MHRSASPRVEIRTSSSTSPYQFKCRTLYHRSRAYHLANQYAELPSKCGGVTTGTVAHVRTLDMNPSQAVHPAYGQPPLSFYLSAWNHTGDNTLHVVHKDLSSPVAKTLDVLRRSTNMPIKMHSHDRFKDLVPTLQHDPRPPTVYSLVGGRGSELYLKGNRTQLKTQTNATVCLAQYEQSKEVRGHRPLVYLRVCSSFLVFCFSVSSRFICLFLGLLGQTFLIVFLLCLLLLLLFPVKR
jgi:hypothetical protein